MGMEGFNAEPEDKVLPEKVMPSDPEGQREYNEIDHEETLYHADLAKAIQENGFKGFGERVDELPQDTQIDLGVRHRKLKRKIEDFNKKWATE